MSASVPHSIPGLVRASSRPRVPLPGAAPGARPLPVPSVTPPFPAAFFFNPLPIPAQPFILTPAQDKRLDSVSAPHPANPPVPAGITQMGILPFSSLSATGQAPARSLDGEGIAEHQKDGQP